MPYLRVFDRDDNKFWQNVHSIINNNFLHISHHNWLTHYFLCFVSDLRSFNFKRNFFHNQVEMEVLSSDVWLIFSVFSLCFSWQRFHVTRLDNGIRLFLGTGLAVRCYDIYLSIKSAFSFPFSFFISLIFNHYTCHFELYWNRHRHRPLHFREEI